MLKILIQNITLASFTGTEESQMCPGRAIQTKRGISNDFPSVREVYPEYHGKLAKQGVLQTGELSSTFLLFFLKCLVGFFTHRY
jgi:hypothetical protein